MANPSTILAHKTIRIALIINKNNPKVSRVTGRVKRIKIGLTNTFNTAKTKATKIEVVKSTTATPGKKWEIINTKTAVNKIFATTFIFFCYKIK